MKRKKSIKGFSLQQDQSDCGVACLLSIIKYYGGTNTIENLRRLSGTATTGTTLLGLYQAARELHFDADGCEADISVLMNYPDPVILHVCIEEKLLHYIVCYGTEIKENTLKYVIGDPAKGIVYLTPDELEKIWISKTCLTLKPNEHIPTHSGINKQKKQWIVNLVKADLPLLALATAIGIVIAVLGLIMALFSQRLIDDILPNRNITKLNLGIVLVLLLLLAREGLSFLRQTFLLRQSSECNTRLIDYFYSHLLHLPKLFFDTCTIGELTARLNDTARIQRVISQLAGNVIIDLLVILATMTFLFFYSWQVALGCLVALPVYFMLLYRHYKPISKGQREVMSRFAQTEANYISSLQGIDPIKNYNKQELYAASNKTIYQQYQATVVHLGKIQIRLSFIANSFAVLFLISVLLFTGHAVIYGQLKAGELMAILSMCSTLLPGISNLALIAIPVNEAKIAFDRMFEFTSTEQENKEGNKSIPAFESLRLHNIGFRFAGRAPLLKNVSLEVKKGECIAMMGENGCGKSTLIQLLQRAYLPETGTVLVNGDIPLEQISLSGWRRIIGSVPQNIHIFNGTVLENIAFDDATVKPLEVVHFLQHSGFSPFIEALPQSYGTLVGEEGINLSGGQKQIIALARALYHKPQLLILDEAMAAMDVQAEAFVLHLLSELKKETGIILITHQSHSLKNVCDRIYLMEKGMAKEIKRLPEGSYRP